MKRIKYLIMLALISIFFASCLKEEIIITPGVKSVKMYMTGIDGKDSLVTEAQSGKTVKFVVETDADICTVWPGGTRIIMKKVGSQQDSLDMFNHPVLIKSDLYTDYGLVGARGFKGTLTEGGWYVDYTYPNPGEFNLTIIITNHGYNSGDYQQVVVNGGTVIVN